MDTPRSAREVFVYLGDHGDPRVTADQQAQCAKIGAWLTDHPILGGAVQILLVHRYQRQTGDTTFNWQNFLNWLVQNMPTIIQVILSLITVFGGGA